MRVSIRGRFMTKYHIWFENYDNIKQLMQTVRGGYDSIIVHGNSVALEGNWCKSSKQESLVTDLSKTNEELWTGMTKTIRNEINRSQREGTKIKYYYPTDILADSSMLQDFAETYHNMYTEKGLENHFLNTDELLGYAEAGCLLISVAILENAPVVWHSYVFHEGTSRFLHSCSEFRVEDNVKRNSIGRANKYLHWRDFDELRKNGVRVYDWGGVSSLENPNGIDKFKMSFGNEPITYYNATIVLSLRNRMLSVVKRVLKK